MLFGLYLDFG